MPKYTINITDEQEKAKQGLGIDIQKMVTANMNIFVEQWKGKLVKDKTITQIENIEGEGY